MYACEINETMVAMSRDILAANGIADVTLMHSLSTSMSVPRDLPQRSIQPLIYCSMLTLLSLTFFNGTG